MRAARDMFHCWTTASGDGIKSVARNASRDVNNARRALVLDFWSEILVQSATLTRREHTGKAPPCRTIAETVTGWCSNMMTTRLSTHLIKHKAKTSRRFSLMSSEVTVVVVAHYACVFALDREFIDKC